MAHSPLCHLDFIAQGWELPAGQRLRPLPLGTRRPPRVCVCQARSVLHLEGCPCAHLVASEGTTSLCPVAGEVPFLAF